MHGAWSVFLLTTTTSMGMVIRVECFGYFYRICMHTYMCVHTCIFMCVSLYKTKPWIGSYCCLLAVQAQRRSREHSRSASALSLSGGDEKSEPSDGADQHLSYYSNGGFFATTTTGTRRTNMPFIHVWGQMVSRPSGKAVLVTGSCSVIPIARGKKKAQKYTCKMLSYRLN